MKTRPIKTKLLTALLTLCMLLSLVPMTAFAAGVNYIPKVSVAYDRVEYKAGEAPRATASVTEGNCTVAYEYWRELYQKEEGGVWYGTGRYWYSDPDKMASLSADKRITEFEAGHTYSYNIVLVTDSYYAFSDDVVVSVGGYEWGTPESNPNLAIKEMSTELRIYSPDSINIPSESQTNTITSAAVQNVKFDYKPGDAPQATAWVAVDDTDKYEIAYECWQEFENNEPVAAWYSDNGSHGSLPTITEFESGKEYVYFVMLKQKDGYSFSSETAVTVNGESVKSSLSGEFLYVPAVKSIKPVERKPIELIEINDVTTSFKVGDTPVFTGNVSANALYYIDYEGWNSKDAGVTSSEYWNGRYGDFEGSWGKLLTSFEANTEYTYSIYLKLTDEAVKSGYYFDKEKTKLSINGEIVDMREDSISIEPYPYDDVAMFYSVLTMTPEAGGTTPAEKYTVTYTDGVAGEEIFKDQTYTAESGKATPAFNGTPVRDGYKFVGWSPAVTDTVTGNVTYTAQWEKVTPAEKYTVTYTDGVDEEEIFKDQTYTVESGKATPAFNGTPARDGYKFAGWSPAVTDTVTGNVTYTAQWEKVETPAEKYTVTYTDGVAGEEIFKDQTYTVESGKATPAFNGTPTRKGYTFTGWKPAVAATVTGNATYEATWKSNTTTTTPSDNKPNTGETTSPKTGDTSNMVLWATLLFVSCGALAGIVVIGKKKKTMK